MSIQTEKRISKYKILADATGFSEVYCKKVVLGKRSQTSVGGKKIMKEFNKRIKKIISA